MGNKRISVQQSDPPKPKVVLAEAIEAIGKASRDLSESGLNQDAIVTLLVHKTKISRRDITTVLDGMKQLRSWYCK
jgi:hypothetical protein